jgi:hypothetical protein
MSGEAAIGWIREVVLVPWRVYRDPAGHPFCLVVR